MNRLSLNSFLLIGTLAMSGCTSTPEIVSAGNNLFISSTSGGIYTQDIAPIRAQVYKSANDYCEARGLAMEQVSEEERPYQLGGHTASVKLVFKAVAPNVTKENGSSDQITDLERLKKLLDNGGISKEEYDIEKARILKGSS